MTAASPLVECVPNFSAGRDPAIIDRIAAAVTSVPGVALLDRTSDCDHNRSVLTFAGAPEAVLEAAVRSVEAAAALIDLRRHTGVHPRIGAADVVPFVPVRGISLDQCATLAHTAGQAIWSRCGVPVYFYEAAALLAGRTRLESIRKGGFETLLVESRTLPERHPDIGGPGLHPSAGASVVGARKFLIAYNINLRTPDLSIARRIARLIRTSSGGLPAVKALGLPLESRGETQVSMNLTDFKTTSLADVFLAVTALAAESGVEIAGSELIGLIPEAALPPPGTVDLLWENFRPDMVLEQRLIACSGTHGVK